MREKRRGALGLAEGVANTVRRMQRERESRVLLYDETGFAWLLEPESRGYEQVLVVAQRMVELEASVLGAADEPEEVAE